MPLIWQCQGIIPHPISTKSRHLASVFLCWKAIIEFFRRTQTPTFVECWFFSPRCQLPFRENVLLLQPSWSTYYAILKDITHYKVLYGKGLSYNYLWSFSYLAYATTLLSSRKKFTARVVPTFFVGYPHGYKAYRLFSIQTHKFFISRDVVSHETTFPFHELPNTSISQDPFHDFVIATPIPEHNTPVYDPLSEPDIQHPLEDLNPPDNPNTLSHDISTLRRSTRNSCLPTYLNDYAMTSQSPLYPIQ